MKYKRVNNRKKRELVYEGKVGTAVRAVRSDTRYFPVIESRFQLREALNEDGAKERLEEIVLYMDLEDMIQYHRDLTAALQASVPSISRGAGSYQYGEGTGQ